MGALVHCEAWIGTRLEGGEGGQEEGWGEKCDWNVK